MVIFQSSKHVFWQALVFTIIVFGAGLIFGYYLESSRADASEIRVLNSELNILDEQIRAGLLGSANISCEEALESTFSFADKIYDEAVQLEKYDAVSKFNTDMMRLIHKRYDLLRVMLWNEGISLKKRCGTFHTIVYVFDYGTEDVDIRARQTYFSRVLMDMKNEHPDEILLIPIAGNLELASIEVIKKNYNINSTSILADEKNLIDEIITYEELEDIVFKS